LIEARALANTTPVYLRAGADVPEGIAPERIVFVTRTFVDPPERPQEPALVIPEARSEVNGHDRAPQKLNYPSLGPV
jgi:hypothetical protein